MFKLKNAKGQSGLEVAILMIIVIAALLSIQVYIKRGLQGRLRAAADDIGDQYSAGNTNVYKKVHVVSNTKEENDQGDIGTSLRADEVTTTNRTQNITNLDREDWGFTN